MDQPELDIALKLALVLVASGTFIIIGVAAANFFRRPVTGAGWRMRLHEGTSIVFALAHVATLVVSPTLGRVPMLVALACYGAGLGLFVWAQETVKHAPPLLAFSDMAPEHFVACGPFRLVRHPFYLASMFIWGAGVIATASPWLLASALWMAAASALAAREEERWFEASPFAERYRCYRARTGMFLPRFRAG
jgi:protein-S-isoprenylcysteine O-methyltransferase Ste14